MPEKIIFCDAANERVRTLFIFFLFDLDTPAVQKGGNKKNGNSIFSNVNELSEAVKHQRSRY